MDLLVILGRGMQRLSELTDPAGLSSWHLTEDLEICDANAAHLPVRVVPDDDHPRSMVGGGVLNLCAGMELIRKYRPAYVVCAYAHRADYLKKIDAPSESEVMSSILADCLDSRIGKPGIISWDRSQEPPQASNTGREVFNALNFALEHGSRAVAFLTVGVHVPRTATYVAKQLSVHEKYRVLAPVVLESEEVLLRSDEQRWRPRIEALRASKSFARSWARESEGISKIVRDVYGDAKPNVTAN